ncbi:hypothetical protein ACLOJK_003884 [Asimina triloba]
MYRHSPIGEHLNAQGDCQILQKYPGSSGHTGSCISVAHPVKPFLKKTEIKRGREKEKIQLSSSERVSITDDSKALGRSLRECDSVTSSKVVFIGNVEDTKI